MSRWTFRAVQAVSLRYSRTLQKYTDSLPVSTAVQKTSLFSLLSRKQVCLTSISSTNRLRSIIIIVQLSQPPPKLPLSTLHAWIPACVAPLFLALFLSLTLPRCCGGCEDFGKLMFWCWCCTREIESVLSVVALPEERKSIRRFPWTDESWNCRVITSFPFPALASRLYRFLSSLVRQQCGWFSN